MTPVWLAQLDEYVQNRSYGLAAIRVLDYNDITFGIIEPYGYYLMNYKSEIYLLRNKSVAIKFYVNNNSVATSIVNTGALNISYIDALFTNPPAASSRLRKFILFHDQQPRSYTAIQLINRCLDLRIFYL